MLRPQELLDAREQVAARGDHADGVQADRGPRGRRGDRAAGARRGRDRHRRRAAPPVVRGPADGHGRRRPSDRGREGRLARRRGREAAHAARDRRAPHAAPVAGDRGVLLRPRPHEAAGEGHAAEPAHAGAALEAGHLDRGLRRPVRRLPGRRGHRAVRGARARRDGLPVHPDRRARARDPRRPGPARLLRVDRHPAGADAGRGHRAARRDGAGRRRAPRPAPVPRQQRGAVDERGRLRRDLRGRLQGRPRLRRLPPRVRRPPLGRLRPAARRPRRQDRVARPRDDEARRPRDGRHAAGPHRRGRAALPARAAVAVHAVRVRVGPGGQPDRVRDPGAQAGARRRGRGAAWG